MITNLIINKKTSSNLVGFIQDKNTIYITQENKRKKVSTLKDLKFLLSESSYAIKKSVGTIVRGVLFVWKSDYAGMKRNYVKVAYETIADLDDLLMMLNWSFSKEVYCKIKSNADAVSSFRRKGFKICYERDGEVLLFRSRNDRRFFPPIKEEDLLEDEIE